MRIRWPRRSIALTESRGHLTSLTRLSARGAFASITASSTVTPLKAPTTLDGHNAAAWRDVSGQAGCFKMRLSNSAPEK
jgi:hypothetical protein